MCAVCAALWRGCDPLNARLDLQVKGRTSPASPASATGVRP